MQNVELEGSWWRTVLRWPLKGLKSIGWALLGIFMVSLMLLGPLGLFMLLWVLGRSLWEAIT